MQSAAAQPHGMQSAAAHARPSAHRCSVSGTHGDATKMQQTGRNAPTGSYAAAASALRAKGPGPSP